MEGHTDAVEESAEETLNKLARRSTYSNLLDGIDMSQLTPNSKALKETMEKQIEQNEEEEKVQAYNDSSVPESNATATAAPTTATTTTGGTHTASMDTRVTKLVQSIHSKLSSLSGQVDNLSARVDNFAAHEEQPILMVPQRVNMSMIQRLGDVGTNMQGINQRVGVLENRAASPIMMVPQYQQINISRFRKRKNIIITIKKERKVEKKNKEKKE